MLQSKAVKIKNKHLMTNPSAEFTSPHNFFKIKVTTVSLQIHCEGVMISM